MIDIKFLRDNPEIIKNNLKRRYQEEKIEWIETIISNDKRWRNLKQKADRLRQQRNTLTDEIRELKQKGQDITPRLKLAKEIPNKISTIESEMEELKQHNDNYLKQIPNILHESVPEGKTEEQNKPFRFFLEDPKPKDFELRSHVDLLEKSNLANFDVGRSSAGQGFNYLIGDMARLDLAIQRYGVEFLEKKGF